MTKWAKMRELINSGGGHRFIFDAFDREWSWLLVAFLVRHEQDDGNDLKWESSVKGYYVMRLAALP